MTGLRAWRFVMAIGLAALPVQPGHADGVAGPYLAGRVALSHDDYSAAATAFTQALLADPGNPGFLENAILSRIAINDIARAKPMVAQLQKLGIPSQSAAMMQLADLALEENYDAILADLDKGLSAGKLVDGLFRAWSLVGQGKMSDATVAFDEIAAIEGLRPIGLYHKALALASVGDYEGAEAIFASDAGSPLRSTRRGVIAQAQVLSQIERIPDAIETLTTAFGTEPDPLTQSLLDELNAGRPLPFTIVTGPKDGLAEVFFTVAAALLDDDPDIYALTYARLAAYVRPGHVDAILMAAGILETQDQFELATETYNLIPREDPSYHAAELGRAAALIQAGRTDAAIEVLTQVAKAHPNLANVWVTLGDTLRREERYAEAIKAYDGAIATFDKDRPVQWTVYFSRGIAYERENQWPEAEADFNKALALQPDQPQVLNYLGYSLVEKGENLDEALAMIERAEKAEPESGYIVDSLGWALYRLGRYQEAVGHMERAIALMPVDPVVNDHLGDVYWAVGRKLEAEFQWRRALSFEPETEEDAARIRRKLEVGLDVVLKEEGAAPLSVSVSGGDGG